MVGRGSMVVRGCYAWDIVYRQLVIMVNVGHYERGLVMGKEQAADEI